MICPITVLVAGKGPTSPTTSGGERSLILRLTTAVHSDTSSGKQGYRTLCTRFRRQLANLPQAGMAPPVTGTI